MFISHGYIPTISLPTRITHSSTTLIGNIYVKCDQLDNLVRALFQWTSLTIFLFLLLLSEQPRSILNQLKSHVDQ